MLQGSEKSSWPVFVFPTSAILQWFLEVLSGVVVTLEAGRRENGRLWLFKETRKEVTSVEKVPT